ncbi:HAD-IA family hydrolase [Patescibacteria group bacterium]|nr:HAD-IA family hydrolase [Patescibacteria group bacterium]
MKKYQYFLFDWDGCLVNTLSVWMNAYKNVFSDFHVSVAERDIVDNMFGDWNGASKFGITDVASFNKKVVEYVRANMANVQLYPGVFESLQKMKGKKKEIAILSLSNRKTVLPVLERLSLYSFVDLVLTEEDVSHHKPHPEVVEKALFRLKGNKFESVVIGDTEKDILLGKNAGIDSIVFYPTQNKMYYKEGKLKSLKPTHFMRNFLDILKFV